MWQRIRARYSHLQSQLQQLDQTFGIGMEEAKVSHPSEAARQHVPEQQRLRELAYDIQGMLALGGVATRASSTRPHFCAALDYWWILCLPSANKVCRD